MGSLGLGENATIALVVVYLINWLKRSKLFGWISYETPKVSHLVAVVTTFVTSFAGVHFAWDPLNHSLLITGLSLTTIVPAAWTWLQQYVLTKVGYHALETRLNPPNGGVKK